MPRQRFREFSQLKSRVNHPGCNADPQTSVRKGKKERERERDHVRWHGKLICSLNKQGGNETTFQTLSREETLNGRNKEGRLMILYKIITLYS